MLNWYMRRYSVLFDFFSNVRVLIALQGHSSPVETLEKIKKELEETIKGLANESKEETETE